jgi:phage terminase large subunit
VQVLLPETGKPRSVAYGLAEIDEKARDAHLPLRTEDEIGGYVWDANKEQPVKENDDGCDATRYAVSNFDLKGTGDVLRWLD